MTSVGQAVLLWRTGRRQEAVQMCEALAGDAGASPGANARAADGDSGHSIVKADALSALAEMQAALGQRSDEISSLRRLLRLKPRDAAVWRRLGYAQLVSEEWAKAASSYRRSVKLEPDNARGHNNLGQALVRLQRRTRAISSYRRALELDSNHASSHHNLGIALFAQGEVEAALKSYRSALELQPTSSQTLSALCSVLLELKRPFEALIYHERALRVAPPSARVHNDHAGVLTALGRFDEALECCDRALRLQSDFAEAFATRAAALRQLHRYDEARAACSRAMDLKPDFIAPMATLAEVLMVMGDQSGARDVLRRILELEPARAEIRLLDVMNHIPQVPQNPALAAASRETFATGLSELEQWLHSHPEVEEPRIVGWSTPFYLAYQATSNRTLLVRHGKLCADLMSRWHQREIGVPRTKTARASGSLRVGIVSAHIRDHSVFRALVQGWISQLDRRRLEVGILHLGGIQDSHTTRARAHADFFIEGLRSLHQWVETIRSLDLDVLVFPEIGMHTLTLQLASLRLVPHQVAAWGHPETTGLPTIDYYLSAQSFEPPEAEDYYSERLVPLENLGCYYEPYDLPATTVDAERLGVRADRPVFWCCGTPYKYAPEHDVVLVEIAQRLGRCQFVFFDAPVPQLSERLRDRLSVTFRAGGLDPSVYLTFIPWQNPAEFFGLLRQGGVLLDTIGFSGFNTLMQAVECTLPTVTFEGGFMRGRFGSGIMNRAGLPDLVARTRKDYVELAVRLATDGTYRLDVQRRMKQGQSLLFADAAPIHGLARFLQQLPGSGTCHE
jgi:protein O-GlcNAc transferase